MTTLLLLSLQPVSKLFYQGQYRGVQDLKAHALSQLLDLQ
jgi:hypothetical protein